MRIMLAIGITSFVMLTIISGLSSYFLTSTNYNNFIDKMKAITAVLSVGLRDEIISADSNRIDAVVASVIETNQNIIRICVFNNKGQRLSTGRCRSLLDAPYPNEQIIEVPITVDSKIIGSIGVAFSTDDIQSSIHQIHEHLWTITVVVFIFNLLEAWIFSDYLSIQVMAIYHGLIDKTPVPLIPHSKKYELEQVAIAVNDLIKKQKSPEDDNTPV